MFKGISPATSLILQSSAIFRSGSNQVNNFGNTTRKYRLQDVDIKDKETHAGKLFIGRKKGKLC